MNSTSVAVLKSLINLLPVVINLQTDLKKAG